MNPTRQRRAAATRHAFTAYGHRSNNSIDVTTAAATPLPGTTRDCKQKRRRLTPNVHNYVHYSSRSFMTIPATVAVTKAPQAPDDTLFTSPPAPDGTLARIINAALETPGLSAKAHRLLTAAAVHPVEWRTTETMALLGGITDHAARPLLAELVRAGLMVQTKKIARSHAGRGRPVRNVYSVVVPR